MEIGNEQNDRAGTPSTAGNGGQQGEWRALCDAGQRIYFLNLKTKVSQWLPPADLWTTKLGLPYGWEVGICTDNTKYYINHVNKTSSLEDPRSEADQATHLQMLPQAEPRTRKIQLSRDASIGYGFVAGSEKPVVIRSVITGGPSCGKLFANDQILRVNGEDVSQVPQVHVINLIKSCSGVLELHVISSEDLQDAKNQNQRRSSLMSRATRERRRYSPVNVRFAEDIALVQYIGPAEQARRASLPIIPNVLKVFLENGQTRSFRYDSITPVQEIFSSFGPKLGINALEHFSLVLSGPQKSQISLIQNHEKVSEIYVDRNCSRASWVCKLHMCFVPSDPNKLLEKDPAAFDYLYDQISSGIVEGYFDTDLKYDMAIKLTALHMQQKATEATRTIPSKITARNVEKDFDGLENFMPANLLNSVKTKELRKALELQIKYNQSLAGPGQRYLSSRECKQYYLKLACDLVSYGGKYFKVVLFSNSGGTGNKSRKARQQEATLLVSPKYGLSQVIKGKVNLLCQLADIDQITRFYVSFHAEGKRLLKISVHESKDILLFLSPLDSMDIVTFITGYQKLWNKPTAPLQIEGQARDPLTPLNENNFVPNEETPPYKSVHRVIPDTWSYPSFLQVPGNTSDHNFFVDLSKDPPSVSTEERPEETLRNAVKRPSTNGNTSGEEREESVLPNARTVGKRLKVGDIDENTIIMEEYLNIALPSGVESPHRTTRELYRIAEEDGHSSIHEEDKATKDDWISQLVLAEEMWKESTSKPWADPQDAEVSTTGSDGDPPTCNAESMGDSKEIANSSSFDTSEEESCHSDENSGRSLVDKGDVAFIDGIEIEDVNDDPSNESVYCKTDEINEHAYAETDKVDREEDSKHVIPPENMLMDTHGDVLETVTENRMKTSSSDNDYQPTEDSGPEGNEGNDDGMDYRGNDVLFDHRPEASQSYETSLQPKDFVSSLQQDSLIRNDVPYEDIQAKQEIVVSTIDDDKPKERGCTYKNKYPIGSTQHLTNRQESDHSEDTDDEKDSFSKSDKYGASRERQCSTTEEWYQYNTYEQPRENKESDSDVKCLMESSSTEEFDDLLLDSSFDDRSLSQSMKSTRTGQQNINSKGTLSSLESNSSLEGENKTSAEESDSTEEDRTYEVFERQMHDMESSSGDTVGAKLFSYKLKTVAAPGSMIVLTRWHSSEDTHEVCSALSSNSNDLEGIAFEVSKATRENANDEEDKELENVSGIELGESNTPYISEERNPRNGKSTKEPLKVQQENDFENESDDETKTNHGLIDFVFVTNPENGNIDTATKPSCGSDVLETAFDNSISILPQDYESIATIPQTFIFLGEPPGESEDGPVEETSDYDISESYSSMGTSELRFSPVDWIIPSPPSFTEELFSHNIKVVSPPPTTPASSPVDLHDNMFKQLDIERFILPPPPSGLDFEPDIKVISPPPVSMDDLNVVITKKMKPKEGGLTVFDDKQKLIINHDQALHFTFDNITREDVPGSCTSTERKESINADPIKKDILITGTGEQLTQTRQEEISSTDKESNNKTYLGIVEKKQEHKSSNTTFTSLTERTVPTRISSNSTVESFEHITSERLEFDCKKNEDDKDLAPTSNTEIESSEICQRQQTDLQTRTLPSEHLISEGDDFHCKDDVALNKSCRKTDESHKYPPEGFPTLRKHDGITANERSPAELLKNSGDTSEVLDGVTVDNVNSDSRRCLEDSVGEMEATVPDAFRISSLGTATKPVPFPKPSYYKSTALNSKAREFPDGSIKSAKPFTSFSRSNSISGRISHFNTLVDKDFKPSDNPSDSSNSTLATAPSVLNVLQRESQKLPKAVTPKPSRVRFVISGKIPPIPSFVTPLDSNLNTNVKKESNNVFNKQNWRTSGDDADSSNDDASDTHKPFLQENLLVKSPQPSPISASLSTEQDNPGGTSESMGADTLRIDRDTRRGSTSETFVTGNCHSDTNNIHVVKTDSEDQNSAKSSEDVKSNPFMFLSKTEDKVLQGREVDAVDNAKTNVVESNQESNKRLIRKCCLDVKNDGIVLIEKLKRRLEECAKESSNPTSILHGSTKWISGMQNNASFLACDVKLLNASVKQLNIQVLTAMRTSLETLQHLVNSCVTASSSQQLVPRYSMRILIGIVNDVVMLYGDVITRAEEAVRLHPDGSSQRRLSEKTVAMTTLIASLIRTLKRL